MHHPKKCQNQTNNSAARSQTHYDPQMYGNDSFPGEIDTVYRDIRGEDGGGVVDAVGGEVQGGIAVGKVLFFCEFFYRL